MVANSPIERVGPGQLDYLLNRLNEIERRLDQGGARSAYPFSVGHSGVRDFSIEPSASGDGTADILVGDGAGGKLIQVITDSNYGTKILKLLDQSGRTMMSTDALSGFGWGTPSYPYPYGGREEVNLSGATSVATALEIGRGVNFAYNPGAYFVPRIRARSATAVTVKVFCQFRHWDNSTYNSADFTFNIAANTITSQFPEYAAQWIDADMSGLTAVFFKAYVSSGVASDVFAQLFYQIGYGFSQRAYNDTGAIK